MFMTVVDLFLSGSQLPIFQFSAALDPNECLLLFGGSVPVIMTFGSNEDLRVLR